jgi:hypothetical protein
MLLFQTCEVNMSQSEYCKFLIPFQHIIDEVGGDGPTVIPNQFKCQLGLSYFGMGWDKCKQTPFDGPCWQYPGIKTIEEWNTWVSQHLGS